MHDISKSASYVQNSDVLEAEADKRAVLASICENATARHVWELLETPQTVDTLKRRLELEEDQLAPDDVMVCLTELIHADLIQISPDS